jgi:clan AA aspartic protease (TIGR02281 family)
MRDHLIKLLFKLLFTVSISLISLFISLFILNIYQQIIHTNYIIDPNLNIIQTNINIFINDNNITTNAIIDTGASKVVLPHGLATKLNLNYILDNSICNYVMTITANGYRVACSIVINKITLGRCNAYNIEAIVFKDHKDTDIPLLGMSFLNKFKLEMINGILRIYC